MKKLAILFFSCLMLLLAAKLGFADDAEYGTIGYRAAQITTSIKPIAALLVALCIIFGFLFVIFGFFKLKQHKETPTQVAISTGIFLIFLGCGFLFLPTLINIIGVTTFGSPTLVNYTGSINIGGSGS